MSQNIQSLKEQNVDKVPYKINGDCLTNEGQGKLKGKTAMKAKCTHISSSDGSRDSQAVKARPRERWPKASYI